MRMRKAGGAPDDGSEAGGGGAKADRGGQCRLGRRIARLRADAAANAAVRQGVVDGGHHGRPAMAAPAAAFYALTHLVAHWFTPMHLQKHGFVKRTVGRAAGLNHVLASRRESPRRR